MNKRIMTSDIWIRMCRPYPDSFSSRQEVITTTNFGVCTKFVDIPIFSLLYREGSDLPLFFIFQNKNKIDRSYHSLTPFLTSIF